MEKGWRYTVVVPRWSISEFGYEGAVYYNVVVEMYGGDNNLSIASPPLSPSSSSSSLNSTPNGNEDASRGRRMKRSMLRRFGDFLKLHQGLLAIFGGELLPDPPPKLRLRAVNTSAALIEQRRRKLQDWLWQLVSIPRIAQSKPVALFLELEAHAILLNEELQAYQGLQYSASKGSSTISSTGTERNVSATANDDDEEDAITEVQDDDDVGGGWRSERSMSSTFSEDTKEGQTPQSVGLSDNKDTARMAYGTLERNASSLSSGGMTIIPSNRQQSLNFLVNQVQKNAHNAMNLLLKAEDERQAALNAAAAANQERERVLAECDARDMQLNQDRTELESSIREKEVSMEWMIEEEKNKTIASNQKLFAVQEELEELKINKLGFIEQNKRNEEKVKELTMELEGIGAKTKAEMKLLSREIKSLRKDLKEKDSMIATLQGLVQRQEEELKFYIGKQNESQSKNESHQEMYSRLVQEVEVCRKKMNDSAFEELIQEEVNGRESNQNESNAPNVVESEPTIDFEGILSTSDARLDVCVMEANFIADNNQNSGKYDFNNSIPATFASLLVENAKLRRSLNQMAREKWKDKKDQIERRLSIDGKPQGDLLSAIVSSKTEGTDETGNNLLSSSTGKFSDAMKWLNVKFATNNSTVTSNSSATPSSENIAVSINLDKTGKSNENALPIL